MSAIEGLLTSKPWDQVRGNSLYAETRGLLTTTRGLARLRDKSLINIFGPLTVRERWNLLGDYQLIHAREQHSLEGAAWTVASIVAHGCVKHEYPEDVLLLQMVHRESENNPEVAKLEFPQFVRAVVELLTPNR